MFRLKFFIAPIFVLLFFSITPGQSQSGDLEAESLAKFEFALIGDVPYNTADFWKFDNVIKEINANKKLEWVLHAGDIKTGSSLCSDELFQDRLERFQQFRIPFILTPGDNEWTDCHRFSAGSYRPLERLSRLRTLFYPKAGMSLGQSPMPVITQASDPSYPEFVENVRWMKNHVMFATLHIVGSNNALAAFSTRTQADDEEVKRRIKATLSWLHQTFDEAKARNTRGVFLLFQADPRFELIKGNRGRLGFEEILDAFEQESVKFGKPVVLAHGDSHHFRVDKPLLSNINKRQIKNVTRVETFGADDVHWLRIIADPSSPEVFTIHQEIVEQNLKKRSLF
ncbi:metallophosphoesterase [Nitrosomonas sp. Is37]|uniref:metallophosphoesterase n=1 Tax=Nitrosomonas sp. Is37 TaxID=3080535 RepID=UPI00294B5FA7|nr:metallophosphoesterase [Nitrosomonas sp. Is37]MDV6345705.1 metallophosphoesterase [Nitrosomonas sp. Is37]